MIPRIAARTLRMLAGGYPLVAVTGPRQSGKTTLVRSLFTDKPYVSLEDPDQRLFADEDPRGFLNRFSKQGAILDEVQRCPELLSYLQGIVDRDNRTGRFILTGSQQFGLLSGITQTLAGRVGLLRLLPFSYEEVASVGVAPDVLDLLLWKGLYPPLYDRQISPRHWYGDYVATYVERDVRQMVDVRDLSLFQRFIRLCAGRVGQLLNLTSLANDTGVTHNTIRSWLSVLEASYLVHLLPPHHRNFRKRLVKSPKLYFHDTGLAAWLMGIHEPSQLEVHPLRGALFENWIVSELLKDRFNHALPPNLFFWRDSTGNEIDVILEQGGRLVAVEIKSGQTVDRSWLEGLRKWQQLANGNGQHTGKPCLVYGGSESQSRSEAEVLAWRDIGVLLSGNR